MDYLKQWAACMLACAAVLLAALDAHAQDAVDVADTPGTGSVLMLALGLMVAGCMRRREQGPEGFGE